MILMKFIYLLIVQLASKCRTDIHVVQYRNIHEDFFDI